MCDEGSGGQRDARCRLARMCGCVLVPGGAVRVVPRIIQALAYLLATALFPMFESWVPLSRTGIGADRIEIDEFMPAGSCLSS